MALFSPKLLRCVYKQATKGTQVFQPLLLFLLLLVVCMTTMTGMRGRGSTMLLPDAGDVHVDSNSGSGLIAAFR
jgi:hypothetical protein